VPDEILKVNINTCANMVRIIAEMTLTRNCKETLRYLEKVSDSTKEGLLAFPQSEKVQEDGYFLNFHLLENPLILREIT
jgi:hypothetical protein